VADQSVVGTFDTMAQAEGAVRKLGEGGFAIDQVSILARDLSSEREVRGYVTAGDMARDGAAAGAWIGGVFGLLAGAALIWVPGFGPLLVAGPLAASLLGGVEGAAIGAAGLGLLGGLAGWGVSREHILKYQELVKAGKFLVVAHGDHVNVARAEEIMKGTGALELTHHGESGVQAA
jgi:hypothetical protein